MFKVGDKAECIFGGYATFTKGRLYEVVEVPNDSEIVMVNDKGIRMGFFHEVDFKRVEEAPTSRANDPATSKGKRKVNKYEQAVLFALSLNGRTGKEIAERSGHPLNCITPRFAPLRRKGLIKDSGIKRDKQIVWVLA